MKLLFRLLLLLAALASPLPALCAPAAAPIPVLALISYEAAPQQQFLQGFQNYFKERGLAVELNVAHIEKIPRQEPKPALIVALGSAAAQYAAAAFKQTPICAGLLIEHELIDSAPNMTGVSLTFPLATHLQWINRFIPHGRSIGVIYNPEKNAAELEELQHQAVKLDIPLIPQAVKRADGLEMVLKNLPSQVAALWSFDDAAIFTPQNAESLLLYSFRNRIPLIGLSSQWVKAGALYALDRDYADLGRQNAEQAWRILQGAPVKQVAPETPRKVLYSINRQTAEHMKLELPDALIRGAYETFP